MSSTTLKTLTTILGQIYFSVSAALALGLAFPAFLGFVTFLAGLVFPELLPPGPLGEREEVAFAFPPETPFTALIVLRRSRMETAEWCWAGVLARTTKLLSATSTRVQEAQSFSISFCCSGLINELFNGVSFLDATFLEHRQVAW